MLGEDGGKMSKSKRNYREPNEIFDRYGADALRWYFFANQPPWTSIRYSEQAIKDCIPEFLLRLWNVYSFFVIYANIDGFDPAAAHRRRRRANLTPTMLATAKGYRPLDERGELDRWILSELNRTAAAVVERMDAYDNFAACGRLTEFVDALSNWYVRRSRDRFWSERQDRTGQARRLLDALRVPADDLQADRPVRAVPGRGDVAEPGRRGTCGGSGRTRESVHLCDYPPADAAAIDEELSERMSLVREIVSLGRAARMGAKLKVRQPLAKVEVVLADRAHQAWLEEHASLIGDELNVKQVEFTEKAEQYITYTRAARLEAAWPAAGQASAGAEEGAGRSRRRRSCWPNWKPTSRSRSTLPDGPVALDADDIQVRLQAKEGWAAAQGPACVVVLATELTHELIREGLARELVRAIQDRRKELDCEFTDRIVVGLVTDDAPIARGGRTVSDYMQSETLAVRLVFEALAGRRARSN